MADKAKQCVVTLTLALKADDSNDAELIAMKRLCDLLHKWADEDSPETWTGSEGAPRGSLLHWGFKGKVLP